MLLKKALIGTALIVGSIAIGRAESNLLIKDRTGVETILGLSTVKNITFPNLSVSILKSDASVLSYYRSDIRTIRFSPISAITPVQTGTALTLHKNPVFDELSGEYTLNTNEAVRIQVVSIDGRVVNEQLQNGTTGTNSFKMPVNQLANGLYLLKIQRKGSVNTFKFIKK